MCVYVNTNWAADGIPKPVIKWRRESQSHELPAFDDSYQSVEGNELDVGSSDDEGRKEQTGDITNTTGDLNERPQMALKSQTTANNSAAALDNEMVASERLTGIDKSVNDSQYSKSSVSSLRKRRQAEEKGKKGGLATFSNLLYSRNFL